MQNIFLLIRQKCSKINGADLRPGGLLYYSLCHSNNIFRAKIVWWFYFIESSICCFCQPLHLLTLDIFGNIFAIYCTLLIYYFGRNLPASSFIPSSPTIRNSRVMSWWGIRHGFLQRKRVEMNDVKIAQINKKNVCNWHIHVISW